MSNEDFPKTLYVNTFDDEAAPGGRVFDAQEYYDDFARCGQRIVIAEYRLVRTFGLVTQVKED